MLKKKEQAYSNYEETCCWQRRNAYDMDKITKVTDFTPTTTVWQHQGRDPGLSINRPLMRQQNTGLRRARSTRSTRGWASPMGAPPPTCPWMR